MLLFLQGFEVFGAEAFSHGFVVVAGIGGKRVGGCCVVEEVEFCFFENGFYHLFPALGIAVSALVLAPLVAVSSFAWLIR